MQRGIIVLTWKSSNSTWRTDSLIRTQRPRGFRAKHGTGTRLQKIVDDVRVSTPARVVDRRHLHTPLRVNARAACISTREPTSIENGRGSPDFCPVPGAYHGR